LRDVDGPLPRPRLEALADDATQVDRCLASLVEDGLLEPLPSDRFALPS
jgi:A/G-specific adenine glycosylase